jgi:beta-lactamase regulating signal transducer with metallopeptidase domain
MPLLLGASDWTDALLAGLLGFAIRATILLLGAWVATRLMRRASAATRHLVWTGAIAGVLALPLLGVLAPEWKVTVIWVAAKVDAPPEPSASTPASKERESARVAAPITSSTSVAADPAPRARSERVATPTLSAAVDSLTRRVTVEGVLATAWLMLAFLLLARLAIANARVSAWQRSSRAIEDERWLSLLRRLSRRHGIERPVILLENDETDVPVTWGIVYPVILVPASAERWDEEQRIAVLTHELAHVKRFDALTQLFAQIALALLWFHPLVWMAVRRMRLEREHACDDFVLVAGARASRYADDLLGLARRLTRPTAPAAAALAMARRSELEGRLLAILDPGTKRTAVRRARVGVLTMAVLLLATPLAAFRPGARAVVDSTPTIPTVSEKPSAKPMAESEKALASQTSPENPKVKVAGASSATSELEALTRRLGATQATTLQMQSRVPALSPIRTDTEPPRPIDLETLIEITKAAKPMTSDHEKGLLLRMIAKRYVRNEALRDAYLDAVSTMTSDHERSQALIALLARDSLPVSAAAQVLRSAARMTSDVNKGMVLKRISPAVFADSAVQRAYLDAIVAMTSDVERGAAIGTLVKQRPLTPAVQVALLKSTNAMTSNNEKANVLLLFLDKQGIADEAVKRSFFKTASTLTSDADYRRVMTAVMR